MGEDKRTVKDLLVELDVTKDADPNPDDSKRKTRDGAFRALFDKMGIDKQQCKVGQLIAR